jgi:galactokinase
MNNRPSRHPGPWRVSTPGRVCLFGEHQDYLDLPVISAAISLRLSIEASPRADTAVRIDAPDISKQFGFDIAQAAAGVDPTGSTGPAAPTGWRKFLLNSVKVLAARGFTFSRGFDCTFRGNIPIRGGTSSSSAMVVSWVNLLARASDQGVPLTGEECALVAWQAEVVESGGVGGKMDQYATAVGGLLFQEFHPVTRVEPLPAILGAFVLGDSQAQKDTQAILAKVKYRVLDIVKAARAANPEFSLQTVAVGDVDRYLASGTAEERTLIRATVRNRDITRDGVSLLRRAHTAAGELGAMLNEQQSILGGTLGISTGKIDAMVRASLEAGAAGCKINGSGGGGCMFAYAPDAAKAVAEAIAREGGRPYIIRVDEGTRAETADGRPSDVGQAEEAAR